MMMTREPGHHVGLDVMGIRYEFPVQETRPALPSQNYWMFLLRATSKNMSQDCTFSGNAMGGHGFSV